MVTRSYSVCTMLVEIALQFCGRSFEEACFVCVRYVFDRKKKKQIFVCARICHIQAVSEIRTFF